MERGSCTEQECLLSRALICSARWPASPLTHLWCSERCGPRGGCRQAHPQGSRAAAPSPRPGSQGLWPLCPWRSAPCRPTPARSPQLKMMGCRRKIRAPSAAAAPACSKVDIEPLSASGAQCSDALAQPPCKHTRAGGSALPSCTGPAAVTTPGRTRCRPPGASSASSCRAGSAGEPRGADV